MHLFSELKQEAQEYLPPDQVERIYHAYQFAAKAHAGQQRHSGDPYITHPLAVAKILAQMHMDAQTLIVALLHDVIEDTAIEKNSLANTFGPEIAELVDGMSKLTQIQFQSRAEAQAENFRKMLLAMAKDIRIILIKLADRLHNMRTLSVVPPEKRQRIARETLDIYAPIAQRLGMHALRVELEDLCLWNLHPWRHRILETALQKTRRKRKALISKIEAEIKTAFQKNHLRPTAIWQKKKHLYPIYKKMRENHLGFNEIIDIPIFCILVDNIDSCYRVLGTVHNLYKPLPDHFHDYIALPKANGYQALHTTLFGPSTSIHIQIRTTSMDKCAEHGIVSYWLDQNKESELRPHLRAREWLKRLLDIQKTTSSSLEFIESVKIDLFPSDIYIFTPKGDIIELPQKATPIDFAYAIHSDIGNHCVTVKIDQQPVPLSTALQSGQTVEIMTDPEAVPDSRWLNFVTTGRARSHIRQFFKAKQHNEAVQLGQRLLDNTLSPLGKESTHLSPKHSTKTLSKFHYASFEDLLEAIGLGYVHPLIIASSLTNLKTTAKKDSPSPLPLFIKNAENSLITFSECCRPIPDDEIIGLLNAGHGLTIHLQRCKYAVRLLKKNKDRAILVQWEKITEGFYKTDLYIEILNQRGALALLTNRIAKANTNIDNLRVENHDREHSIIHFTLSVRNRKHLAKIIRLLRTTKAIVKITRHRALST
ncbi:guanosine-3' 5'-bis(Diphosphate) 3'-pyrophosphohydrolase [Candidatus Rickettsiella viridis]|uniref:guanosine-3',5'-bis(diphosphate) 3'-diphosphatase n=1 Tax=Candidatus Rickettsiella viridis TaxID=676208 RepID=A0A2Z5UWI7_9COXI|nr:bifunctional (p)ppGpp synthetase/guanosine-3',5'-bis(diphosphate) 3'-pyrophosphohydrolase [Candidatus Rickettsiella viridis]BBB15804.1 guanosine-3' 5'-bis(Diphosphate) 3'-pyrophosphohydrolase [Candidatus Rickettsiella viridis]